MIGILHRLRAHAVLAGLSLMTAVPALAQDAAAVPVPD